MSSSENSMAVMGVFTLANRSRNQSPSQPTEYSSFRHQRRHCMMTPLGISHMSFRRLPGKYPMIGTTVGTRVYQRNHAMRLVGGELCHQVRSEERRVGKECRSRA